MSVNEANQMNFKPFATEGAVISEIRKGSYLADIGVRPGDVIRQPDEKKIVTVDDFKKAVIRYRNKSSIVILLQRLDQLYYITLIL